MKLNPGNFIKESNIFFSDPFILDKSVIKKFNKFKEPIIEENIDYNEVESKIH
jgi:hypothetical protein